MEFGKVIFYARIIGLVEEDLWMRGRVLEQICYKKRI